jgi:tRNA pseudouridine13 synthase
MPTYLSAAQPGIGGQLKVEPADFVVEEIPLYPPSGQGQHLYLTIEKQGLSTYAAIKMIAAALRISPGAIGYAGLKDAQAVTRQTLSLDKVEAQAVHGLVFPNLKILQVAHHQTK